MWKPPRLPRVLSITLGIALVCAAPIPGSAEDTTPAPPDSWKNDLSPLPDEAWNADRAAFLLERAGFGGTPEEIEALAMLPHSIAVAQLVRWQNEPNVPLPAFRESQIFPNRQFVPPLGSQIREVTTRAAIERRGLGVRLTYSNDGLWMQPIFDRIFYFIYANSLEIARASHWVALRMLVTERPLEEKLALFWHGHFAASYEKLRDYRKSVAQWELFRERGNGSFRKLLLEICRDPAMLIYLDGFQNVRGHPNENFARELMELFSLGIGSYSENDIQEVSRAFTGWGLSGNRFHFDRGKHDSGAKVVFGHKGALGGEEVVDLILAEPASARFISARLYRYFVREDLDPALNEALAVQLRESGWNIGALLERIFRSRDFYSTASRGTRVKSPIELIVSTYRKLGVRQLPGGIQHYIMTENLGQSIFNPPNVAGWKGGRSWINPSSLMLRQNFARAVLFPDEIPPLDLDLMEILVTRTASKKVYAQMKRLAARGNRTKAPRAPDSEMGLARVDLDGAGSFNLNWAYYNGAEKAVDVVRFEEPVHPKYRVADFLAVEDAADPDAIISRLTRRFLSVPIEPKTHAALRAYWVERTGGGAVDLEEAKSERALRELLHLILSLPEHQIS